MLQPQVGKAWCPGKPVRGACGALRDLRRFAQSRIATMIAFTIRCVE